MNNHRVIEKYTKLVMKELYNQDIQVFFSNMDNDLRAIFREKGLPPYKIVDNWNKEKCNITFDKQIFRRVGELPPHTWKTIVHEISHYEIGIEEGEKGTRHTNEFYNLVKNNMQKIKNLQKEFEMRGN